MNCSLKELDDIYRPYIWNHFTQHSEQRLKMFNFFIILCTVIIGALATLGANDRLHGGLSFLPMALVFLSFLFWKLDTRTKMLIKVSEEGLKYLDELLLKPYDEEAYVLAPFTQDDNNVAKLSSYPLSSGFFSYTRVFNWFFSSVGLIGVVLTLMLIL